MNVCVCQQASQGPSKKGMATTQSQWNGVHAVYGEEWVKEKFAGLEICFKNGKMCNGSAIEKYVFASPTHEWYVLEN